MNKSLQEIANEIFPIESISVIDDDGETYRDEDYNSEIRKDAIKLATTYAADLESQNEKLSKELEFWQKEVHQSAGDALELTDGLEAHNKELEQQVADYKEVVEDGRRLAKEMDVIMNGADAAEQASLCDVAKDVQGLFDSYRAEMKLRIELQQQLKEARGMVNKLENELNYANSLVSVWQQMPKQEVDEIIKKRTNP